MISTGDEKQTDTRAALPARVKNHGPLGSGNPQGADLFSDPAGTAVNIHLRLARRLV